MTSINETYKPMVALNIQNGGEFYPRDRIVGSLDYAVLKNDFIKDIKITLTVIECTKWIRQSSTNGPQKEYGGKNILVLKEKLLPNGVFDSSRCNQSFTIDLPMKIPASFQSRCGWVKFFVTATLSTEYSTSEVEQEIKVIAPIRFDRNAILRLDPFSVTKEKELTFLSCFSVESIDLNVHFPKGAFILGEEAKIGVDIHNKSDSRIEKTELVLGQTVTFKGYTGDGNTANLDEEIILQTVTQAGLSGYYERSFDFTVKIPDSSVVPNFKLCKLFSCGHWIKVTAFVSNSDNHLSLTTPVVLGHTPIRTQQPLQEEVLLTPDEHSSPSAPAIQDLQWLSLPTEDTTNIAEDLNVLHITEDRSNVSSILPSSEMSSSEDPPPSYDTVFQNSSGVSSRRVGWVVPNQSRIP